MLRADGIYPNMAWGEYRGLDVRDIHGKPLSGHREHWSSLKTLERSPAHYLAAALEDEDSDARAFGRAGHLLCLEPQGFETEVVVWDGKVRNGGAWEEFKAQHAGKEILTRSAYDGVRRACANVRKHRALAPLLKEGAGEVSVLWTARVGETEIPVRQRIDWLCGPAILDLKFVEDASGYGFARLTANLKYHGQGALYQDGYRFQTGDNLPFILVAIEKKPPYALRLWELSPQVLEQGRALYCGYLQKLAACIAFDAWEAYEEKVERLHLPTWAQEDGA